MTTLDDEHWERVANKFGMPGPMATFDEHANAISSFRRCDEDLVFQHIKETCESPIEQILYAYLWYDPYQSGFRFRPQQKIGQYRVDFVVEIEGEKLVVECDGHDFHEKTKEQATKDKKRDRFLVSQGYKVLRFTGSEIKKNPLRVISEIADAVYGPMVKRDLGY